MERAESVEDILNSLMLVSPAEIGTVSFAEKLDTRREWTSWRIDATSARWHS